MKIFDIEKYFGSSKEMEELIVYLQEEYFDRIDYHSGLFRGGALSDINQLKSTLEELNGIFMDLKSIHKISITFKKNREDGFYIAKKIETENKGEKFVSAPADKEASNHVANERRIRNIIEGKLEACNTAISVCQSELKYATAELGINGGNR